MFSTGRTRLVWLLPVIFTVTWLIYVLVAGHWTRVADHWYSAVTMTFGSFVAGSTPQGGGSVAFPVFTKALDVPASVARSFGLIIQSCGMGMAAATILLAGRRVDFKALRLGILGGTIGFGFGALVLGESDTPFWDSVIPAPYVKVSFTIAVTMVATIVWLCSDREFQPGVLTHWTRRNEIGLIAFTAIGGLISALTGSGVDVFLFLFVVLIGGLNPRIGVPTSVITMAWLSVLGLILFGFVDGQLNITLAGDQVVAVGGEPIEPLAADRADLFGFWLAAAPVVVWGAPLGSWVASIMTERILIVFVATMATAELITTIIFLDDLHTNPALAAYGLIGLVLCLAGTVWLARRGPALFGFPTGNDDVDSGAAPSEPPAPVGVG